MRPKPRAGLTDIDNSQAVQRRVEDVGLAELEAAVGGQRAEGLGPQLHEVRVDPFQLLKRLGAV